MFLAFLSWGFQMVFNLLRAGCDIRSIFFAIRVQILLIFISEKDSTIYIY